MEVNSIQLTVGPQACADLQVFDGDDEHRLQLFYEQGDLRCLWDGAEVDLPDAE